MYGPIYEISILEIPLKHPFGIDPTSLALRLTIVEGSFIDVFVFILEPTLNGDSPLESTCEDTSV